MLENFDLVSLLFKFAYSIFGPLVAGLVCGVFVMWRSQRKLDSREFFNQINFSLNRAS